MQNACRKSQMWCACSGPQASLAAMRELSKTALDDRRSHRAPYIYGLQCNGLGSPDGHSVPRCSGGEWGHKQKRELMTFDMSCQAFYVHFDQCLSFVASASSVLSNEPVVLSGAPGCRKVKSNDKHCLQGMGFVVLQRFQARFLHPDAGLVTLWGIKPAHRATRKPLCLGPVMRCGGWVQ